MSVRDAIENAASITTPVPVGVSGATIIGVTVEDWVLIGTAFLVAFQIIVILPKVIAVLKSLFRKEAPSGCKQGTPRESS